jgi:hypothetical protein
MLDGYGDVVNVDIATAMEAYRAGALTPHPEETYSAYNQNGDLVHLSGAELAPALQHGFRLESESEAGDRLREQAYDEEYGGTGQAVWAGVEGFARGATAGLSDAVIGEVGDDEGVGERRARHAGVASVAEIAGMVAPALVPGGSAVGAALRYTPAGLIARGGSAIARAGAGGGAVARAGAAALGGAFEGAAFSTGQGISDLILNDKPLTAEQFVASVGSRALYGAALGGVIGGGLSLGETAIAGAGRVASKITGRAAKKADDVLGRLGEKVDDVARKVDDVAAVKSKMVTRHADTRHADVLTRPTKVGASDVSAVIKVGDDAAAEAKRLIGSSRSATASGAVTPIQRADEILLTKRLDDLATAKEALPSVLDNLDDAGARAIEDYHATVRQLGEDLGTIDGARAINLPPNPIELAKADKVAIGDLFPSTGAKESLASIKSDLRQRVTDLDDFSAPVLAEARRVAVARKPVAELGATDLRGLVDEAAGASALERSLAKVERAEASYRAALPAPSAVDDIIAADAGQFAGAMRSLERYEKALREVSEQLDQAVPLATGGTRIQQLDQVAVFRPKPSAIGEAATGPASWDIGDTLAVADLVGIDISDAPIVGQIPGIDTFLKARLAYRRIRGIGAKVQLAGGAGRVGKVAERAAAFKDRASAAVDSFLSKAKVGKRALKRGAVPTAVVALNRVSYAPEGDGAQYSDPKAAFSARAAELAAATANIERFKEQVRGRVAIDVPELADAIAETAAAKVSYLQQVIPRDPRPESLLPRTWAPDSTSMAQFVRCVWAAERPLTVLEQVAQGRVTPQAAEALKAVYPAMFADLRTEIATKVSQLKDGLDHRRRVQLSTLFDLPVTASEEPEYIAAVQAQFAAKPGPQPGGGARMRGLDQMTSAPTPLERQFNR